MAILITDFLNFEARPMGPMLFCIVWEIAVLCCWLLYYRSSGLGKIFGHYKCLIFLTRNVISMFKSENEWWPFQSQKLWLSSGLLRKWKDSRVSLGKEALRVPEHGGYSQLRVIIICVGSLPPDFYLGYFKIPERAKLSGIVLVFFFVCLFWWTDTVIVSVMGIWSGSQCGELKTYVLAIYTDFPLLFSTPFVSGLSPYNSSFFPRCVW